MINEAEQIVYQCMHYGWPCMSISLWASLCHKRKQKRESRAGGEERDRYRPSPRPAPTMSASYEQAEQVLRWGAQRASCFPSAPRGLLGLPAAPIGGWSPPNVSVVGLTNPASLCCGGVHVIMVIRIPSPLSVPVGTEEAAEPHLAPEKTKNQKKRT